MKTPVQTTQAQSKKSGFTLIEIVIVLAIAALIMVIVFVAVAGAQRSRRDTDRRAAASRVLASLTQCASDNSGVIGTTATPGPPVVGTTINCASYMDKAGGRTAGMSTTVTAPTAADDPFASSIGNATSAACAAAPVAFVPTTSGGKVCVYYYSEQSATVVFLTGTI